MKTYCPSCGNKMEYKVKKPNFCQNCGNSLAIGSQPVNQAKHIEDDEFELQEENFTVPTKGLEFIFETDKPASETLGTIFQQASQEQPPPEVVDFTPQNPMSAKEHLDAFRNEAGTLKEKEE